MTAMRVRQAWALPKCPRCHSVVGVPCAETVNGRSAELREVDPHAERMDAYEAQYREAIDRAFDRALGESRN